MYYKVSGNNNFEGNEQKRNPLMNQQNLCSKFEKIRSISGKFTDPYDVDTEEEVMNSFKSNIIQKE